MSFINRTSIMVLVLVALLFSVMPTLAQNTCTADENQLQAALSGL